MSDFRSETEKMIEALSAGDQNAVKRLMDAAAAPADLAEDGFLTDKDLSYLPADQKSEVLAQRKRLGAVDSGITDGMTEHQKRMAIFDSCEESQEEYGRRLSNGWRRPGVNCVGA